MPSIGPEHHSIGCQQEQLAACQSQPGLTVNEAVADEESESGGGCATGANRECAARFYIMISHTQWPVRWHYERIANRPMRDADCPFRIAASCRFQKLIAAFFSESYP